MKGYMGVSQQVRVKTQTCLHIDRYTEPGTQSRLSIHLSDIFIKKQELHVSIHLEKSKTTKGTIRQGRCAG